MIRPNSRTDKQLKIMTIGRWLSLSRRYITQYLQFTFSRFESKQPFSVDDCLGWFQMNTVARRLKHHRFIFENISAETVADLYYLSFDKPELVFNIMVVMILVEDDHHFRAVMQFLDLIHDENLIHYFTHYSHNNSLRHHNGANEFVCHQCDVTVNIGRSLFRYIGSNPFETRSLAHLR